MDDRNSSGTFLFNTNQNTIDVQFYGNNTTNVRLENDQRNNHIPVHLQKNKPVASIGSDVARDIQLKFELDNFTGRYLTLTQLSDGLILSLMSKSDKVLSSVEIWNELPSIEGFTNKYLYLDSFGNLTWRDLPGGQSPTNIRYDTTIGWDSQPQLVSEISTIYVYTDKFYYIDGEGNTIYVPGIKIGDGNAYLIDKPFITDAIQQAFTEHMNDLLIHVQPGERERWNNKLNYIEPGDSGLLEFTRN